MTESQGYEPNNDRNDASASSSQGRPPTPDPTMMRNQPALRTSSGAIWIIMGGLFAAASLVPLIGLGFVRPGASAPPAIATSVIVVVLFAAIVVTRFAVLPGPRRLRHMMVYLLAMAAVAIIGVAATVLIEAS